MSHGNLKSIEALFQAAADLPPEERAAFLEGSCRDSSEREQVEAMLVQLERDETLASPVVGLTPPVSEAPGTVIGRYRLLQKIGEGGFGTVYRAEQTAPVRREVALKIIKPGMDTREVVARFEAERQALALMDHPSIARVLDGGATDTGRPYFVMELVRGKSITSHCDAQGLSMRERLELFVQVCHAVQHAHQKGVIHRDLKPSNVLVTTQDGQAVPKVIDFGVAKAIHARLTDKTLFTVAGRFLGTPAYMSPEQAEMSGDDIDTRSDIYSLGVLLYELITGTTPFEPASMLRGGLAEIQRVLREEQPPRPSIRISTGGRSLPSRQIDAQTLSRQVRGDLDWIVMKALEKERSRRYDNASDLAADVRRHLDDEPVLAGEPSRAYRLRKLIGRHRTAVGTAAAIIVVLTAGVIGTSAGMLEAAKQRDAAQTEAVHARAVTDFLVDTLALTDPRVALDPRLSVRTLLDRASTKVGQSFSDQPEAAARIRSTIGRAYENLGEHELAETHLRAAVALIDELDDYDPADEYLTLWRLTHVLFKLERPDAFLMARRARGVAHAHVASSHPELGATLDEFLNTLGAAAHVEHSEELERARELFADLDERLDRTLPPGDPLWPIVADTFMDAGYTLWYTPHEPANEAFFAKALEIQRRELPPNHPDIAESVSQVVGVLNRNGRAPEAESRIRETIETLHSVYAEDSFQLAFADSMLGENLVQQGRFAEAEPILLHAHRVILDAVKDESTFYVVDSYGRMVALYSGWGREESARSYREALARIGGEAQYAMPWRIVRQAFGPGHEALTERLDGIESECGTLFYSAKPGEVDSPVVASLVRQALEYRRSKVSDGDVLSAVIARLFLGWSNALVTGPAKQLMLEDALRVLEVLPGQADLEVAEIRAQLGEIAWNAGDVDRARRLATESTRVLPGTLRKDWITATAQIRIGRCYLRLGLHEEAEALLHAGHDVLVAQMGEANPSAEEARRLLGELYSTTGRPALAARYEGRAT